MRHARAATPPIERAERCSAIAGAGVCSGKSGDQQDKHVRRGLGILAEVDGSVKVSPRRVSARTAAARAASYFPMILRVPISARHPSAFSA
jgi:hypothetical protein